MGFSRLLIGTVLAAGVTFGLFLLMKILISEDFERPEAEETESIQITRAERDERVDENRRDVTRNEQPDEPPPPPPPQPKKVAPPKMGDQDIGRPDLGNVDLGKMSGDLVVDGDVQPIVRIPPQYPVRMAQRGIEGWVTVELTIGEDGSVIEAKVVASSNSGFERAALQAVRKWKYKPQIVNGQAVIRRGIRVTIEFNLAE